MADVINFSKFFGGKKELPKFNKKEILEDFYIQSEKDEEEVSIQDEIPTREVPVEVETSEEETAQNVEESLDREDIERLIQEQVERIRKQTIKEYKVQENLIVEQDDVEEEIYEEATDESYPVYIDKNENFSCDIEIEGAQLKDTQVRLVLETENWNLLFNGEIDRNGKVNIPIRKLSILEEGTRGVIKMEVIAEGSVFTPWEQDFEAKRSKKVSVSFNENKKFSPKPSTGVKVSVKKK
jgi:hypothetical protein